MSDESQQKRRGWLDYPEVSDAFQVVLNEILPESDRGAVIIAADMVANHFDETFRLLAPHYMQSKLRRMVAYPGVASTLSAKVDIAALSGWIDESVYRSIGILRKIRNNAAHSNASFTLHDHKDRINGMLNLGDNVSIGVHNMAVEILVRNLFHSLQASGEGLAEKIGKNPFASFEDIAEELKKRPDWSQPLEERLPRLKLGIGVCLILWLTTLRREKLKEEMNASQRSASSASGVHADVSTGS